MKVTYDKVANAAYIYFGNSPVSFTYSCDPVELRGEMINLDFDIEGHLVGIEILNASKVLGSGDTILNSDETRREGRGESEQEPKKEKEERSGDTILNSGETSREGSGESEQEPRVTEDDEKDTGK